MKLLIQSALLLSLASPCPADDPSAAQLRQWLKRFPAADTNGDGKLTAEEATQFRARMRKGRNPGVKREFRVDPGWKAERFPEHSVCYLSPDKIREVLESVPDRKRPAVISYPKPSDGSLRIIGTGHSFMAPGYRTLPLIAEAAGLEQPPLLTHTGGGMTGSARYKWEQENGIFQFEGKPKPILLSSIANARWDAMMWGPYFNDRPEYYACWIEFCLKYNPDMKFFISDAWPQLDQMKPLPKSEKELTFAKVQELGGEKNEGTAKIVNALNEEFGKRVFVMPTSDAMVLAVREFEKGNLPGIDGIHQYLGGRPRSLWKDRLGHLGPGFDDLEGYVFYATLYGKSPELIEKPIRPKQDFPSPELDKTFRKIAWEAVSQHPLSGVPDANGNGIADEKE